MSPQRARVLMCGAYRYGNIGDDAYRWAFTQDSLHSHVRYDSPFPSADAIAWADVIVIGGGGLIYCNDTSHFDYMRRYMEGALDAGKPLFFSSVGVQLGAPAPITLQEALDRGHEVEPWAKYLREAVSVTTRSPTDAQILQALMPDCTHISWALDACYSLRSPLGELRSAQRDLAVMVPTGGAVYRDVDRWQLFCHHAQEAGLRPMILAFGSDDVTVAEQLARRLGMPLGGNRVWLHPTVPDVLAALGLAKRVITGRYHGHVLARACGVPEVSILDERYKSVVEPTWTVAKVEARPDTHQPEWHASKLVTELYRLGFETGRERDD